MLGGIKKEMTELNSWCKFDVFSLEVRLEDRTLNKMILSILIDPEVETVIHKLSICP